MERLKQNREQKDVAFGVCVPSYLSKIEHGQVKPEENILRLLFQKLHIDYQGERFIVETHQKKILAYFERLHYGLNCHEIYSELEKYQEQLSYSVLAIDWYLIKAFEKKAGHPITLPIAGSYESKTKILL
jgi:HTH-type transcriptional regulator, quorum sensing regulator NprR